MTYSWPVVLKSEDLTLQALRFRDRPRWNNVRAENRDWLSPWEATIPLIPGDAPENANRLPSYFEMVRTLNSRLEVAAHFHLLSGISAI
jgi:ribosomal-protein-alanine N-acetyltransferase